MSKRWSNEVKDRARYLRQQGYSYGKLVQEFGVAKSTLNFWIKDIKGTTQYAALGRVGWAKKIQPLAVLANRRKRDERLTAFSELAKQEVETLSFDLNSQKAILVMLYWAEGSKGRDTLTFANTDPRLVLLFITLLRNCYPLDEEKLRVRLHLHDYHDEEKLKIYWSKLLKVPIGQFNKTYRKSRSSNKTFRQNFGGICFVKYNSVHLKDQILIQAYAIAEKITNRLSAPIA